MTGPRLLYGMGATKAGSSWLYRMLHGHPDCRLREVKEAHYWDTFAPASAARQAAVLRGQIARWQVERARAAAEGKPRKAEGLTAQMAEVAGLIAVLEGDRAGDRAYLDWLFAGSEGRRIVADVTPAYGIQPAPILRRMATLTEGARYLYLMRDPLARLWSHVRMEAARDSGAATDLEQKANGMLKRIIDKGVRSHVLERGDYPAIVARIREHLPADALRVEFCERLQTDEGWRDLCLWLGIGYHAPDGSRRVHQGPKVALHADLAGKAVRFLKEHYDWAAQEMGPLPREWQDSLAKVGT
ncbi:MAG: sulfotransferase [Rubellimicrobium sp.]|nr:sulfotransferase [Rubellimicrobium sp.]